MNTTLKTVLGIVVLAIIGVGVYFLFVSGSNDDTPNDNATLEGNVALVNSKAITQENFETQLAGALTSFASQGADVKNPEILLQIKTQVLNDLINNELVRQNIEKSEIKVSTEDVDREVQIVLDQAGSQEAFEQQLTSAGLTEEQLRSNISNQLAIQVYLAQNVDISGITITDEELQKFYDDSKAAQPDLPPLEEVTDQARQQLLTNKQQLLVNEFIATLREEADVETTPLE